MTVYPARSATEAAALIATQLRDQRDELGPAPCWHCFVMGRAETAAKRNGPMTVHDRGGYVRRVIAEVRRTTPPAIGERE